MEKYNVGFSKLDKIFNGLELGSVILIGGRNNSGKTSVLNNFMVKRLIKKCLFLFWRECLIIFTSLIFLLLII